jgi:hypothetical protein
VEGGALTDLLADATEERAAGADLRPEVAVEAVGGGELPVGVGVDGDGLWRAGCSGTGTSGSEGRPQKPTRRNAGRALRSDPYTFRFNRRASRSRGLLWYRLIQQALHTDPHPYDDLVAKM